MSSPPSLSVIITDSSDPEGPAESLFDVPFTTCFRARLLTITVLSSRSAQRTFRLNLNLLKEFRDTCRKVFPVVEYAYTTVPTYTSGQLGLFVCYKTPPPTSRFPLRKWSEETEMTINRYYTSTLHTASFVLPTWARLVLNKKEA